MAKIVTYGKKGNYQEVKEKKEEAAKRKRILAKEEAVKATKPARKRVKVDTADVTLSNIPLGNILEEETIKIHIPKELRIKDSELEEAEIAFTETEKAANDLDYEDYINSIIAEKNANKKEDIVWDVKIGDPIDYFDPELSYEATGYRPITNTKGLDFDPRPFQLDAETKKRTGKYTSYRFKSLAYNEWWAERDKRCTEGYTYNGYTITGDHYFFLNFYRLQSAMGDSSNDTTEFSQEDDFPSFIVEQYKYFHYIKLAEMSGKDAVALKARGVKSCPPLQ